MSKKTNTDKTDFYVGEQYRTNPLSSIPAPNEVKIDNKIYNNIHYPDRYLNKVNHQTDETNPPSNSMYIDEDDEECEEFDRQFWFEFYGGVMDNDTTDEEMERFIESQEPDW